MWPAAACRDNTFILHLHISYLSHVYSPSFLCPFSVLLSIQHFMPLQNLNAQVTLSHTTPALQHNPMYTAIMLGLTNRPVLRHHENFLVLWSNHRYSIHTHLQLWVYLHGCSTTCRGLHGAEYFLLEVTSNVLLE